MNPLTVLDDLLADYASPRARRLFHSLLLLVATCAALWLSVEGDWKEALLALLAMVYTSANRANTDTVSGNEVLTHEEG